MSSTRLWRGSTVRPAPLSAARDAAEPCELSAVVPVCDEEANLAELWERLEEVLLATGRAWEVLFVDDGSRDGSAAVLAQLRMLHPRLRVLSFPRNRGQSAALAAGFRAARGRWIVTLDADLQNPPEEIARLLAAREDTQADLVFGRRARRHDGRAKRLASRIGNAVRNRITGHTVADTGCSLKLFRVDAVRALPLFDGAHRFLPTLFEAHGFRIHEVEVDHAERRAGRSKYGVWDRARRGLVDCFAVRWLLSRSLDPARPPREEA